MNLTFVGLSFIFLSLRLHLSSKFQYGAASPPQSSAARSMRADCETSFAEGGETGGAGLACIAKRSVSQLINRKGDAEIGKTIDYFITEYRCVVRWRRYTQGFESEYTGWRICHLAGTFRMRKDHYAAGDWPAIRSRRKRQLFIPSSGLS